MVSLVKLTIMALMARSGIAAATGASGATGGITREIIARHDSGESERNHESGSTATMSMDSDSEDESTDDDNDSEISAIPHVMKHKHGVPILETHLLPEEKLFWENYNTTTYFTVESKHHSGLVFHVALMLLAYILVYPVCLVLNNVESTWYYPLLLVHSALVITSLICLSIFLESAPDLYPGKAYKPMCWILFFGTIALDFFAIVSFGYKQLVSNENELYFTMADDEPHVDTCVSPPLTLANTSRNHDPNSFDLNSDAAINEATTSKEAIYTDEIPNNWKLLRHLVERPQVRKVVNFFGRSSVYLFNVLNWSHFFYFLVYLPTGVATFFCLGQGTAVFNLAAHFIKGGVFFSLGLLSLARYCGALSNKGWAWNHKFVFISDLKSNRWARLQSQGLCTMEMLESSLILFYGCTNVFMEHLANPGGEWTAKDLQHASIAFIYIGCGLCGVLTEKMLSKWRFQKASENYVAMNGDEDHKIAKAAPGFSPNPFPILTIFWTGILMSKHQQASELSTEIHSQWGSLLAYGTGFRLLSYILLLALPRGKDLTQPFRPFSELLTSFCLLCGGLIFMESTDPIVYAFEYRGYTTMFTLNVSLGAITLLMAWEMSIFFFKDWLVQRQKNST